MHCGVGEAAGPWCGGGPVLQRLLLLGPLLAHARECLCCVVCGTILQRFESPQHAVPRGLLPSAVLLCAVGTPLRPFVGLAVRSKGRLPCAGGKIS